MASYWTAVATRYSQERRAAHHVERQGFEFYLPMMLTLTRSGTDRRELVFPGYIFVRVKAGWQVLASTRGIARLFLCRDVPTRVPDKEIDLIRGMEDERGFVRLRTFPVGTDVLVSAGSYEGLRGVVSGMVARDRCRVLGKLLGRDVEVVLDRRVLETA